MRRDRIGTVYAMQSFDGRYKIGWTSKDPELRRRAIEQAAGCKLRLVGTMRGTQDDEKSIHRTLQCSRIIGEWFYNTPIVNRFVSIIENVQ